MVHRAGLAGGTVRAEIRTVGCPQGFMFFSTVLMLGLGHTEGKDYFS